MNIFLQAHAEYFIMQVLAEKIEIALEDEEEAIRRVLTHLCQLWAINGITQNSGDFLWVKSSIK